LAAHRGKAWVAGYRQPLAVHIIANALNAALGNLGQTVVLVDAPEHPSGNLADLAKVLNGGQVDTLVILGPNPVYTAPADLDWGRRSNAKTRSGSVNMRMKHLALPGTAARTIWNRGRCTDE
jgi:molybdopterin-containing oxidoreductase family iron-sulfur binding subunit